MDLAFANFIFVVIALISLMLGVFIYARPLAAFAIQKEFYAKINWRIEPISLEKEIRNTKLMGLFLIILVILAALYAVITA